MFRTTLTAGLMGFCALAATAEAPPAPPSEVYVAPEAATCEPVTLRIYFQNGEAMLSTHARSMIEDAQARLDECRILDVDMIAQVADARTVGEESEIGADRLAIVAAVLRDEGLLPASASARIESAPSADGFVMARRVDVTLFATDRNIG
ncbi:MAG: hypothetical protein AAGJ85_00280 [Pseudomonadota bacterium]